MPSKTPNLVELSPFTVHFVVPGTSQFHEHEHSYSRHILGWEKLKQADGRVSDLFGK